jgi:hypothetical protein
VTCLREQAQTPFDGGAKEGLRIGRVDSFLPLAFADVRLGLDKCRAE